MLKHMLGTCLASHPLRPRTRRYSYSATTYYSNELYAKRGIYLICIPFLPIFFSEYANRISSKPSFGGRKLSISHCNEPKSIDPRSRDKYSIKFNALTLACQEPCCRNKQQIQFILCQGLVSHFSRVDRTRFARFAISTRNKLSRYKCVSF